MTDSTAHPVEIEGLRTHCGEAAVLEDITLTLRAGEIFGLLGPRGAGKTSLLKAHRHRLRRGVLTAQLLDITVFNWLRRQSWWRAPIFGTLAGSLIDTAIFFSVAFASTFAFIGAEDAFSLEQAPLLGIPPALKPRVGYPGRWRPSR